MNAEGQCDCCDSVLKGNVLKVHARIGFSANVLDSGTEAACVLLVFMVVKASRGVKASSAMLSSKGAVRWQQSGNTFLALSSKH